MHFRSPSTLATRASLHKVLSDIKTIASKGSICVFAGSMPNGDLLSQCNLIIQACRKRGAQIVLDTSGVALKKLLAKGSFELIKPNLDELRQVTGLDIPDRTGQIIAAAKSLLNRTKYVLVSRGPKGALLISKEKVFSAVCLSNRKAVNTVACGDYLLAGFLNEFVKSNRPCEALAAAVVSATAKAWGLENMKFSKIKKSITILVKGIK
jgi:fructose-1-phosphate kinase PfkB-like protein